MKNTITLSLFLLFTGIVCAQIPNIRESRKELNISKYYASSNTEEDSTQESQDDIKAIADFMANAKKYKTVTEIDQEIKNENSADITSDIKIASLNYLKTNYTFDSTSELWKIKQSGTDNEAEGSETELTKRDSIYLYQYFKIDLKKNRNELSELKEKIKKPSEEGNETEIVELIKKIKEKEKKVKELEKTIGKIEVPNNFFPTIRSRRYKSITFGMLYSEEETENINLVTNTSFQISGDNGATIQSELVSAFLGPTRVSFGSLITNSSSEENNDNTNTDTIDSEDTEAFQRLLTAGGGNMYLSVELPVFIEKGNHHLIYFNLLAKAGLAISEFSSDVNTSTGNASLNTNLYASISSDKNEFAFFVNGSFGVFAGADEFYTRLGLEDDKPFAFGQITGGVTVMSSLRFALTFNTFSSEKNLRSGNVVIGAQLLTDLFSK